jgi:hypothetical protein
MRAIAVKKVAGERATRLLGMFNSQFAAGSEKAPRAGRTGSGSGTLWGTPPNLFRAMQRRVDIALTSRGQERTNLHHNQWDRNETPDINKSLQANAWQQAQGSGHLNLSLVPRYSHIHKTSDQVGLFSYISYDEDTASGTLCAA